MTGRAPTVSVCIPTYNRAKLLQQAIESVLAQTFEDFELVISDNASTDETEQVVKSYSDTRVIYSRNSHNIGWNGNMNQVLSLARGEFLTIIPDDDLMMPENLARKVAVLRPNPRVGLVHSKYHLIDPEGRVVRSNTNWGHGPDRSADAVEPGHEVLRALLLGFNSINLPTVLFRRTCYERLGGFTDLLSHTDDYEYWMRIAAHDDVAFLAEPLVKWRVHSGTLTSQYILAGATGISNEGLQEQLLAKRMILDKYGHGIPDSADLKKAVRRETRDRVTLQADLMLDAEGKQGEARAFLFKMCRAFPELYLRSTIWKTVLKTFLSRRSVLLLKRLSPL